MFRQTRGDRFGDAGGSYHTDLDGGDGDIVENGIDLVGHKSGIKRLERTNSHCILRDDSRNGGHAVSSKCGECFQISGNACSAARVCARDSQYVGDHVCFFL